MRKAPLLVVLVAVAALADKPAPVAKEVQKKYGQALSKGRKLADKGKLKEAIAAFQDCLTAVPDDAQALSELGWAAYQLHDLKLAAEALKKSIANAAAPNLKGASLYSLGRVQEDLGDKAGAVASYKESLKERANGVVRARLRTLDAKAADSFDPFAPVEMDGPFAGVAAYCKGWQAEAEKDTDYAQERAAEMEEAKTAEDKQWVKEHYHCDCGQVADAEKSKVASSTAWPAVQVFWSGCTMAMREENSLNLAVKVGDKWYVAYEQIDFSIARRCDDEMTSSAVTVEDVIPGGAPELVWRVEEVGDCSGGGDMDSWSRNYLTVAGRGPSGKPAATPAIELKHEESEDTNMGEEEASESRTIYDVDLKATFGKDGQLELTGKTKGLDRQTAGNLLGKHTLAFP